MIKELKKCIFWVAALFLLVFTSKAGAEELVFWNFWNPKFILPVIAEFEKTHPGVKIRNEQINWGNGLDKIIVAMANGRAPDICELGSTWMGKFMSEGALLEVTSKFKDLESSYLMWKPAKLNGKIYGMPWLAGTRVLFYNKKLFKESGLDPEKSPVTWQQMLQAAQKIHNPAKGIYGFGMNAGEGHILYKKFMPFVWGNGGQILDNNGNFIFESVACREAFDFYLQLQKYSYREKQDLLDEAFKRGKLGMTISGSWNFARYPKDAPELDFNVGLIPRPSEKKGFHGSFLGGEILVLFKTCKNPEIAAEFIRYLTKVENTFPITKEALVSFPAHKEAYNDPFFTKDSRLSVFVEQMKTGTHPPVHPLWIALEKIVNQAVEKAMYGEDLNTVFKEANTEYDRVKASFNARKKAIKTETGAKVSLATKTQTNGNWNLFLMVVIAIGTIFNAIMLTFLVIEVKKNAA